jgi:hypothetical protein
MFQKSVSYLHYLSGGTAGEVAAMNTGEIEHGLPAAI